jgi:tol-pal system protein YbgF
VNKQAIYGRAYTYYNLKDFANASFYFNEYAAKYKNDKNYPNAMLRLADSYYGTKNFDKASEIYNKIFNNNRSLLNNDYAYYQYGQALFKSGRSSKAISEFQNLQSRFPRSRYADDSQYLVGWIYFQQSDFENARKNYEKLFEKYPGSPIRPISYYSIGDCYYNTGNYDSAIVYYSKVLQQYPRSEYVFDAVNGIQYSYIAKDEANKAISFIDQYVENNPGSEYNEQISIKKGEIYYSQGDYEKAKNAYSSFANKYPDSKYAPDAYYWIGKCASNLEQEEEAVLAFKLVIKDYLKAEVGVDAVVELSNIYMKNEQFNKVIELIEDVVSQIPQSKRIPELQYLKASAQVKNNQLPGAYETYNNIITYYDGSIFATKSKIELGILELASQRYENAELLFKDVGESKTDDLGAKAQYYYGVTLFEEGKINDAISALVRVRSVFSLYDEWYTRALIKLGDCYVELNQKGQARDMYRAVLKGHKNDDFAKEANKKLKSL